MTAEEIDALIDRADYLLTNDYERNLLRSKTGLSHDDLLDRVRVNVTTLGRDGVRIEGRAIEPVHVHVAQELRKHDPTGVGDGFRAGFFAGLSWELSLERAAQVGSLVATYVIETIGTQEYAIKPAEFADRLAAAYGADAADDVRPHLPF
jgi:adenosine kinase